MRRHGNISAREKGPTRIGNLLKDLRFCGRHNAAEADLRSENTANTANKYSTTKIGLHWPLGFEHWHGLHYRLRISRTINVK